MALTNGAEKVRFVRGEEIGIPTEGGEKEREGRLKNVAIPICEAYGIPYDFGGFLDPQEVVWPDKRCFKFTDKEGRVRKYRAHSLYWLKEIPKPIPVMPTPEALDKANDALKGKRPIVVTIRESRERSLRNSGPDWKRWAADHDAYVLDDWCVNGMSINERVGYYELARLNIGVVCGQMCLNYTSRRPYLALKALNTHYRHDMTPEWWDKHGWKVGEQIPWAWKDQKIVWNYVDDYDTIEKEFQSYMETNG
jgi:hypothetical protein